MPLKTTSGCTVLLLALLAPVVSAAPPRSLDERITITEFAASPEIVTPTGLDVDTQGRVWVIESHTHFPPDGYDKHDSDRILIFEDADGDGRAEKRTVFADGFTHSMSIAVRPTGEIFLATRAAIFRLYDDDGDWQMDRKEKLIWLETAGSYPHNGLAGFAFDAIGTMHFGFGENLGADYAIVGKDGTRIEGGGEGGNVYRCRMNGSDLEQYATGFWNPHASCIDAFGRWFTVDNDPDSRPPCRLLHVIEGGDYGFKFRNGRKGLHPYTSWNGEVPGTLPMVSGTGEAPSGILAYESHGLPEEYIGNLLVTSWGDHRIERFRLKPHLSSFKSAPEVLIQGDRDFRPVGIAVGPDGSLYVSDWVKRDYKLHGEGRLWKISLKEASEEKPLMFGDVTAEMSEKELLEAIESRDIDVRRKAARLLTESVASDAVIQKIEGATLTQRSRVELLSALIRKQHVPWKSQDAPKQILRWRCDPEQSPELYCVYQRFMHDIGLFQLMLDTPPAGKRDKAVPSLADRWSDIRSTATFSRTEWLDDPFMLTTLRNDLIRQLQRAPAAERQNNVLVWLIMERQGEADIGTALVHLMAIRDVEQENEFFSKFALRSRSSSILRAALIWIGEEQFTDLRDAVEAVLPRITTPEVLRTWLATLDRLDGKSGADFDKTPLGEQLKRLLSDERLRPELRPAIVRELPDETLRRDPELWSALLRDDDPAVVKEVLRVTATPPPAVVEALLEVMSRDKVLMLDAMVQLSHRDAKPDDDSTKMMLEILEESVGENYDAHIRFEAVRSLRPLVRQSESLDAQVRKLLKEEEAAWLTEAKTGAESPSVEEWLKRVEQATGPGPVTGDGWRTFASAGGAGCYRCHQIDGRGGNIGPDLTGIGKTTSRRKLLESIVHPSREVAPQYTAYSVVTIDGEAITGMLLEEDELEGLWIGLPTGEVRKLKTSDVELMQPAKLSVMPNGLGDLLTPHELSGLLDWLGGENPTPDARK